MTHTAPLHADSASARAAGATGLRVDAATGGLRLWALDLVVPGPIPLCIVRFYDSQADDGALGPGWSHSLDAGLTVTSEAIRCVGGPFDGAAFAPIGVGRAAHQDGTGLTLERMTDAYVVSASPRRQFVYLTRHAAGGTIPLAAIRDGTGQAITLEHRGGRPAEARTPDGRRVGFEHGSAGLEALTLDGAAVVRYGYADGALRSVTTSGAAEHFACDDGLIVTHRRAGGADTFARYDDRDRCVALWATGDAGIRVAYDDLRQTTRVLDALGGQAVYRHALGTRVLERVAHDGRRRVYYYGVAGPCVGHGEPDRVRRMQGLEDTRLTLLEGEDRIAFVDYDAHGRAQTASDASERPATLEWDETHNPRAITLAGGGRWTFSRDRAGRVVKVTSPEGRVAGLAWSPAGVAVRDADGTRWQVARAAGRETATDRTGRRVARTLRPDGRIAEVRTSGGYSAEFLYDADGRLAAVSDAERVQMRLDRDPAGRVTRVSGLDGRTVDITRDALGRAVGARDGSAEIEMAYDGERLASVTRGGETATYTDDEGQTVVTDSDGTRRYAASGDLIEHTTPAGRDAFTYGPSGELLVAERSDGSVLRVEYDADGAPTAVGSYAPDQPDTEIQLAYDRDGLLTGVAAGGEAVQLGRDALGRLTSVTSDAATVRLTLDGADRVVRLDADSASALGLSVEIAWDDLDRPVAVRRQGQATDLRSTDGAWSETVADLGTPDDAGTPDDLGTPDDAGETASMTLRLTVTRHGAALVAHVGGRDVVLWAHSEVRVPRIAVGLRRVAALVRGGAAALPVPRHHPDAWLAAWTREDALQTDHTAVPRSDCLGAAWTGLDTFALDACCLESDPAGVAPADDAPSDPMSLVTGSHRRVTLRPDVWRTRAVGPLLAGPDVLAPDGAPRLSDLLLALRS